MGPASLAALASYSPDFRAKEEFVQSCLSKGIHIKSYLDPDFPHSLKAIPDTPILLYFKGNIQANNQYKVAIVGTRQVTDYGKRITEEIIAELKSINPLIISGLAYGVDICAHKYCVRHDIPTVGVLANGLRTVYPALHASTAKEMQRLGGLVSEYPPDTPPDAHRFPARNRIVAGWADVTIVVESGAKGGALITADLANGYHKEVYAVPGNLENPWSKGCNGLIREHKAKIFTSVQDLLEDMQWLSTSKASQPLLDSSPIPEDLHPEEKMVYTALLTQNLHIDQLSWKTGMGLNKLATILLQLELKNMVFTLPGKVFGVKKKHGA